jgi:hypothetical protein
MLVTSGWISTINAKKVTKSAKGRRSLKIRDKERQSRSKRNKLSELSSPATSSKLKPSQRESQKRESIHI